MNMVKTELTERRRKQVRDAKAGKGGGGPAAGALTDGNLCRSMLKTGKCPRGDKCPYNHKEALKQFKKGDTKGKGKVPKRKEGLQTMLRLHQGKVRKR